MESSPEANDRVRTAEIAASLCLATDVGMGFPFEHGLHATLIAMRLCDLLDVGHETAVQTYYASVLMYTGCTTNARENARVFAGSRTETLGTSQFGSFTERLTGVVRALPPPDVGPIARSLEVARRLPRAAMAVRGHFTAICEVAEMLSRRMGLPTEISGLFPFLTERWDGNSILRRAEGEGIPLSIRIVQLAQDAAYQRHVAGPEHAREIIAARAGHAFDPAVAAGFASEAEEVFSVVDTGESAWNAVLAVEPQPVMSLQGETIDIALAAMGNFADLISPSLAGHSSGLARLVDRAARLAGLTETERGVVRRAALVHDMGRVGIEITVWEKPGPFTADEWERVRLHPYHTERFLARSPFLRDVATVASSHHERNDASGYHRGLGASGLSRPARLLAAADAFHAMTEPRAHRPALSNRHAASEAAAEANAGRLDPEGVEVVLEAAGEPAPGIDRPAGLTAREVEVVGLISRGMQTKQVAHRLDISPKTADTHIQAAYRKIGVSTRAAATLFAMEHGLVPPEYSR